jgi:hypothetical protein
MILGLFLYQVNSNSELLKPKSGVKWCESETRIYQILFIKQFEESIMNGRLLGFMDLEIS